MGEAERTRRGIHSDAGAIEGVGWASAWKRALEELAKQNPVGMLEVWVDVQCLAQWCPVCMALEAVCSLPPLPSSVPPLFLASSASPLQQAQKPILWKSQHPQLLKNRHCNRVAWAVERTSTGLSASTAALTDARGQLLHGHPYPELCQPSLSI